MVSKLQKELKAPDEFQKIGQQAVPFLVKHQKTAVTVVIAAVVLGGGIALASYLGHRGEENSQMELGAALEILARPVRAEPAVEAGDEKPPFKTEAEKDEAVISALGDFRKNHAGSIAAYRASLPLAQALLRQGKSDEALSTFDEYLKSSGVDDPLRPTALEGRGYALEQKKQLDQAAMAFDELARENKTDFMKGMGQYHKGRMLLLQGKTAEAAQQWVEINNLAPNSAASRLAAERVGLLAAQGVKIPQPTAPVLTPDAG